MDEDVKHSYNYTFNPQQTESVIATYNGMDGLQMQLAKWEKAESKWFHL